MGTIRACTRAIWPKPPRWRDARICILGSDVRRVAGQVAATHCIEPRMPIRLALTLLLLLVAAPVRAADDLNVEAELSRPGVRVLAVEFFGPDCEPCRRAAPRWKALHDKYRDRGLRFVVVSLDSEGRCPNLGWSPDAEICDLHGTVAERFGVKALPTAFLWSWRGSLLVNNGAHVDAIEAAVANELASLPRVLIVNEIAPPLAKQAAGIDGLVRAELAKTRKVDVLSGEKGQRELEALRKKSQAADVDERCQLQLGQVMPANAKLAIRLTQGADGEWLFLEMYDAAKGCNMASGKARWRRTQPEVTVAEAVADLLQSLRREVQVPRAEVASAVVKQPFGGVKREAGKALELDDAEETVVKFASTPPAAVFVGDKMVCKQTPCQKAVALGTRAVTMSQEDYLTRSETLTVTRKTKEISWELAPDFATLAVRCSTAAAIEVDGQATTCPLAEQRLRPGPHVVALKSPCHLGVEETFEVKRGEQKTLTLPVAPRLAGVNIKAQAPGGDDVEAKAFLDGREVGDVPGSFKVPVCGKKLEVRADGYAPWTGEWTAREGEKVKIVAEMQKAVAVALSAPTDEEVVESTMLGKASFHRNEDGTVTQGNGLVWQVGRSEGLFSWEDAPRYCNTLTLAGGGWRLPDIRELVRTAQFSTTTEAHYDEAFDRSDEGFWSASPGKHTGSGLALAPSRSQFAITALTSTRLRARCVRGSATAPGFNPRFFGGIGYAGAGYTGDGGGFVNVVPMYFGYSPNRLRFGGTFDLLIRVAPGAPAWGTSTTPAVGHDHTTGVIQGLVGYQFAKYLAVEATAGVSVPFGTMCTGWKAQPASFGGVNDTYACTSSRAIPTRFTAGAQLRLTVVTWSFFAGCRGDAVDGLTCGGGATFGWDMPFAN